MLHWTLKSLLAERGRVATSAVGIALALLLALYLDAVSRGEARQIVVFLERAPADVWVLQKGVENLHMTRPIVSENAIAQVQRVPGIRRLIRLVYRFSRVGERGQERVVYVVGVPSDPVERSHWQEVTRWPVPERGQAIIPEPLAVKSGLRAGDRVKLGKRSYRVGGFSRGTFSMANPLVFIDERDARKQFDMGDGASALLIEAAAGTPPRSLAARIEAEAENVRALTRDELVGNDYQLALEMAGALVRLMSLIATSVAGLIVIFSAYAFVSQRSEELAVAKALGAPRRQLLLSALLQTGLVALIGSALALGSIGPLSALLAAWVPEVAVDFSMLTALRLGAATLVVAELAALVPVVYVIRVDPALVFRG